MSKVKMGLLRRALVHTPMQGVNILIGGNAVDALRKVKDPKIQRILRRAVDNRAGQVSHTRLKGILDRHSNNQGAKFIYGKERLKTHAARVAVGAGIASVAYKKYGEIHAAQNGVGTTPMVSSYGPSSTVSQYGYSGGY